MEFLKIVVRGTAAITGGGGGQGVGRAEMGLIDAGGDASMLPGDAENGCRIDGAPDILGALGSFGFLFVGSCWDLIAQPSYLYR
tara:strand:+ start:19041 stop:19292 length:252 start_codon:yes stop_codon:yes gene_type:complete